MAKVLLVVDYQNDFVDGALGFPEASNIDKGIADKVREYGESADGVIITTFDTHFKSNYASSIEGQKLPILHCEKGTHGWKLYGETRNAVLGYADKVVHIEKETFGSVDLIDRLRDIERWNHGIDSIEICGLVTDMCVFSNAVIAKAACPNVPIYVDTDLVGTPNPEQGEAALNVLKGIHIDVGPSK